MLVYRRVWCKKMAVKSWENGCFVQFEDSFFSGWYIDTVKNLELIPQNL